MDVTSLGWRTDIALLRLGGTTVDDRGDHLVVRSPHNPTHWWGNFVLLAHAPAPGTSQSWLDRFVAEFPAAEHRALGFDGSGSAADLAWYVEQGFSAEESAVMTAGKVIEPATVNRDAVYRRLQSDSDWAQSIDLKLRCEDGQFEPVKHRAFAIARAHTNRGLVEAGHGAWFGAFVDGRLVSQMGLLAAGGGLARFQSVETDPAHRRRGLAGSLVYQVGRYGLEEIGADTLVMVADPEYFAIDLYRSVGFVATGTQLQIERRPLTG